MNTVTDKKNTQKKVPKDQGRPYGAIIVLLSTTIFTLISLATYNATDPSFIYDTTNPVIPSNLLGTLGAHYAALLLYYFGMSAWLIPFTLLYTTRMILFNLTWQRERDRLITLPLFTILIAVLFHTYSIEYYRGITAGGLLGSTISTLLSHSFSPTNGELFLFTLFWAFGIILARFSSISYLYPVGDFLNRIPFQRLLITFLISLKNFITTLPTYLKSRSSKDPLLDQEYQLSIEHPTQPPHLPPSASPIGTDHQWNMPASQERASDAAPGITPAFEVKEGAQLELIPEDDTPPVNTPYSLPPVSLLPSHKETTADKASHSDGEQRAQTLEQKLERFGIKGKVVSITHGPAVMLFEYQPSIDTKISTILAREDDLALALQAMSLRIIAPIPGRSVIGFEVAHNRRKPILFSQQLKSEAWTSCTSPLPLILGKDTLGLDVVIDLATMPHLLVAGSTGSGKSVGLHTMIMSLLCSKSPDEIKFILIDPKRLEFAAYADIPHLVFPIVTDPRRAIAALKWAVETMEDRYARMAQAGVRNCAEYNSKFKPEDEEYLPLLVVIIDELADLMMTAGKDVEHSIARLAQMARAAGIHLIAATQRPSVDVITGLIKVNFPSRIAYKVTSKVDSRTILDMMGAEKLLGKGDMLFLDVKGAVHRVHGSYVTDTEIQAVVQHCKAQRAVAYQELISFKNESNSSDDNDELFQEVINYIKNKDEISISLVQRVFRIGYNRSARIIDQLESYGYILPADGSKMRKVSKET